MWFWIAIVSLPIAYYFLKPKKQLVLQKPYFKKDVVYMVQFPVSPKMRTISPFALKLETYLRLKKVNYEPVYTLSFSKKGQTPYIELNGEQIADSNIIIAELEKRGLAKKDDLSEDQKAVNHLAVRTVENHLAVASFLWRYGYNMPEFYEKLCEPYYGTSKSLTFFRYCQGFMMKVKASFHGIGRHSIEEVVNFANEDLKALSNILGDKKFFNGDEPTNIDCAMFGHLVQFLYIPLEIPQKRYIKTDCPNLAEFVDRMKDKFWPDWDEMCKGSCMDGFRGASYEQQ